MDQTREPWYEDLQQPHPFRITARIEPNLEDRFRSLAPFPEAWATESSYARVWSGSKLFDPDLDIPRVDLTKWKQMVEQFKFSVVVAGDKSIHILRIFGIADTIQIKLPEFPKKIFNAQIPADKVNVAWALSPDKPYEPLVIFSYARLVYIFNVCKKALEGCLRGHGQEITSVVVHPYAAHIFCTTSRDLSSRIYDLTRTPQTKPSNPHWPPSKRPSLGGPAHGLDMSSEEGKGIGRCVLVLVGSRSGGHIAEVLDAAFNPIYPVIATCGQDRAVKIWHIPYFSKRSRPKLLREDKPLFSSCMIHKARIISVNWFASDILLTHSAPAPIVKDVVPSLSNPELESHRVYGEDEPGSLILWTWLSADRFFPPGWDKSTSRQQILRCFGSDYQESSMFRIYSSYFFPPQINQLITPVLDTCHGGDRGPFVVFVYPQTRFLTFVNVSLFKPRPPPLKDSINAINVHNADSHLRGWDIALDTQDDESIESCAVIGNGKVIIAGGSKGSVWVFRDKSPS